MLTFTIYKNLGKIAVKFYKTIIFDATLHSMYISIKINDDKYQRQFII